MTATVVFRDGHEVTGPLRRITDFKVVVAGADGQDVTYPRSDDEPKVIIQDRMQHHLDLLSIYRDEDIHNLTAYLWTLK